MAHDQKFSNIFMVSCRDRDAMSPFAHEGSLMLQLQHELGAKAPEAISDDTCSLFVLSGKGQEQRAGDAGSGH
ncbi:MAG: hypothetical protein LBE86_03085 [Gemmobacter sp.]|jgi:hypothetical protein|nr:hypothetical protein [Gemmobacter sp.]